MTSGRRVQAFLLKLAFYTVGTVLLDVSLSINDVLGLCLIVTGVHIGKTWGHDE